jgi:hypothetical protein
MQLFTTASRTGFVFEASALPRSIGAAHGLRYPDHWQSHYVPAGFREFVKFEVPDGMVIVPDSRTTTDDGETVTEHYEVQTQAEADAAAAARAAEAEAAEAERRNTPVVWDQPLEVPAVVLQSQAAGLGVGVVATDEGDLVTFTYHASPVPPAAVIRQRIAEAIATHKAAKAAAKAEVAQLKAEVEKIKKGKP